MIGDKYFVVTAEELGYFLTENRKTSGLTSIEMAERCNVDWVNYETWESGLDRPYRIEKFLFDFRNVVKKEIEKKRGVDIEC